MNWYKRKEFWGGILTLGSLGLELFAAPHTVAYKVGILLGAGLSFFGLKQGYRANNLPSGITKTMDSLPNTLTGIKGEK